MIKIKAANYRRVLTFVSMMLFSAVLTSQVVELPEVRITAESSIKTYLYKKTMRFGNTVSAYDSIPAFSPKLRQIPLQAPRYRQSPPLKGFATISLDSEGAISSHLSFYPEDDNLKRLSLDYSPEIFNNGYKSQYLYAKADLVAARHRFSPGVLHRYSSSPLQKVRATDFKLKYRVKSIKFSSIELRGLRSHIGYYNLEQETGFINRTESGLSASMNTAILLGSAELNLDIAHQRDETALELKYQLPQQRTFLEDIELGLITDLQNFSPSISFRYRPILGKNEYLELYQRAHLEQHDSNAQFDQYPHIGLDQSYRQAITPFNLGMAYHRLFAASGDLRDMKLKLSSSYTVNADLPAYDGTLTQLRSTDLFANSLSAELTWLSDGAVLTQSAKLNLNYLPTGRYIRQAYHPALEFDSELSFSNSGIGYRFILEQNYLQRDSFNTSLPEDIDLSISLDYAINDSYKLYGGIRRLFGSKARAFDGLRMEGREIWVELRMFLK